MLTLPIMLTILQNIAVLLACVLLYDFLWAKGNVQRSWKSSVLTGILTAVVGVLLMMTPWMPRPGILFDTRSILLSVSGLFLGPLSTGIAVALLTVYRLSIGGGGVWMGIVSILLSGSLGILWSYLRPDWRKNHPVFELFVLSFLVHVGTLLSAFLLPKIYCLETVQVMALPFLVFFPIGGTLVGLLMLRRERNWEGRRDLMESKALYSSLVNHMPAGVFRKDAWGRYDYVNDRYCQLKGLTPEEVVGKNPTELAAYEAKKESNNEYTSKPIQRTLAAQGMDHHEWIMRHGMPIVVEESYVLEGGHVEYFQVVKTPIFNAEGRVVGSQGMQFDVSPAKRSEEALLYEQYLLKSFMDNSPDMIYFKDLESRFTRVNASMLTHFNVSHEREILGLTDFDFYDSKHARAAFADEQTIMRTARTIIYKEEKILSKGGEEVWMMTSKFPLKDSEGKITGTFGFSKNITAQKLLERDLRAEKVRAEESDRLKTAFLHNISHEIRTPMNAIIGFSDFLTDQSIELDQRRQFVNIIVQSGHQLMSIIDDIVRISTIESGQEKIRWSDVSLNEQLRFLNEQFQSKALEKGLSLTFKNGLTDERALIQTDETKLTQVISNLLVNAFKFTDKGSIEMGYRLNGTVLEFFVRDTGIGIPEAMQSEIFKRFRQVEGKLSKKFGGSGLGLSISKAYVELLGGTIWVESEEGSGSCFYFTHPYLPVSLDSNAQSSFEADASIMVEHSDTQRWKILVAEDEELNYLLLQEMVRSLPIELVRAEDGLEAIRLYEEQPQAYKLVLMDLKMPNMDGFEASFQLHQRNPQLPIVAVTAYSLESDRQRALEMGCSDVLVKPIRKQDLFDVLHRYVS
ncbi:MAG TPA: ATP-binding protein [Bacteroidales bacterium]|nr:ATP-binding protein [Bacteroidales bacterium]